MAEAVAVGRADGLQGGGGESWSGFLDGVWGDDVRGEGSAHGLAVAPGVGGISSSGGGTGCSSMEGGARAVSARLGPRAVGRVE